MKYLYIALFGFIGAVLRKLLYMLNIGFTPINTLVINIIGSLGLAILLSISFSQRRLPPNLRLGLSVGFFGAFTTFSTLCKEVYNLVNSGMYFMAITYIATSIILGLCVTFAGISLNERKCAFAHKE